MRRRGLVLAVVVVLFTTTGLFAAEVRRAIADGVDLAVTIDPIRSKVGDAITLRIEVMADDDVTVTMPEYDDLVGTLTIRDRRTPLDVPLDGRRRWTHTYTLDTFTPGDHTLPEVTVAFTRSGVEGALATRPVDLEVTSVLPRDVRPEDFRDPKPATTYRPRWPRRLWLFAGMALLYLIGLAAGVYAVARYARRPVVVPPIPPDIRALAALEALEADDLLARRRFEPFYTRLSEIVRTYVEERFDLRAREQTTDEFLRAHRTSYALTPAHRERLAAFLRAADLVKFAAFEPTRDDGKAALMAARQFVEETRPASATETPS